MPPASRAAVEQDYFAKEFGFFFRINTGWITPLEEKDKHADIFQKPYLNLVYYLQKAFEEDSAELNGSQYTLDDFCYKPISGEGCLVESPMQYFKMDLEVLNNPDTDVKTVAQCIPAED